LAPLSTFPAMIRISIRHCYCHPSTDALKHQSYYIGDYSYVFCINTYYSLLISRNWQQKPDDTAPGLLEDTLATFLLSLHRYTQLSSKRVMFDIVITVHTYMPYEGMPIVRYFYCLLKCLFHLLCV
jgi:hypothetical protein